jgi:pimeloyl-ACP methyl ester carboxylesterase
MRTRDRFSRFATVWFALCSWLYLAVGASAQSPPVKGDTSASSPLSSCQLPGLSEPARCGVIFVPENPDKPEGRQLGIHVAVIPAKGRALPDPLVLLMGGPGEDTISAAADLAVQFAGLRDDRDLLLIDQRGTGKSGALRCALYTDEDKAANIRDVFPTRAIQKCARNLRRQADLTQYTYAHFSGDLEHVRRTLGYGPLNLLAGSYGTRAAQVFVRAYPKSVRTVYFGSVVPIDVAMPLPMAKGGQRALEQMFEACAAETACQAAFPNLKAEFAEISARLAAKQVRVTIDGRAGKVLLPRGRVAEWFRSKLYRPAGAVILPWLIHRAYQGDWTPIVDGILADAPNHDAALSFGLFFAITCNEDVAYVREQDVASETKGTFLGDYRLRQQQAACKPWPKTSLPEGYRAPVQSEVPALFVSGDSDGGTPAWLTARSAPGFSNRVEILLRGLGHTEWNECVARLHQALVKTGTTKGIDPNACKAQPRPPFKIS